MEEQSYSEELENRREFLRIMNNQNIGEVKESLLEQTNTLDRTDFSRDSGQIKKKGLVKLLLAEYDEKTKNL